MVRSYTSGCLNFIFRYSMDHFIDYRESSEDEIKELLNI